MKLAYFSKLFHPEEWRQLLADPESQWRDGYSAKMLAYAWQDGIPAKLNIILEHALRSEFKPLFGFPEFVVSIPGGSRGSQNDIYVIGQAKSELVVLMIEGKVKESFDKTLDDKVQELSHGYHNARLKYLCELLGIDLSQASKIRYQLIHRLASVVIEAQRIGSTKGFLIIHSFSKNNDHYEDFQAFLSLFGVKSEFNMPISGPKIGGIEVSFIWFNEHA